LPRYCRKSEKQESRKGLWHRVKLLKKGRYKGEMGLSASLKNGNLFFTPGFLPPLFNEKLLSPYDVNWYYDLLCLFLADQN
jgi:hypothetical protein